MKTIDVIQETFVALASNKARTGLTMLGIVIGIASVIAMVAIGQGAQSSVETSIQSIGANLIQVMPGAQSGAGYQVMSARGTSRTLTYEDAIAIAEEVGGVESVSAEASGRYQVAAKGTNVNTSVVGTVPAYQSVRNLSVAQGSFISDQHLKTYAKVAVLGPTAAEDLFGEGADPVGQSIRVNGMQFKVIGVTEAKGGTGFASQDDTIFIPLTSAQQFLVGGDYVTSISVQAEGSEVMDRAEAEITALLLERHDISDPEEADFSIFNQNDIVETASSVTQTFTILLGAVAGISLVVGGIGIMNMMLTTVTERTREIGLRKAIGAKKADISKQFLIEAVALTVIGGVIGIVLGAAISFGVEQTGLLQTEISATSVLLAFGVSAAIGIAFGYYPARRAASLNPIEALRYE